MCIRDSNIRSADFHSVIAGNCDYFVKLNGIVFVCIQLFNENLIACADTVLLSAGFNNCVHLIRHLPFL